MGVVIRRWVWLESIGVVSGCFPHITYISLLHLYLLFFAAASLLLFAFCYILYRHGRIDLNRRAHNYFSIEYSGTPL